MLWWLADFHADGLANGRATVELEAGSVDEICIDGDAGAESPLQFRFA